MRSLARRLVCFGALLAPLLSCAAHNSHRVRFAPDEQLGPLFEQALGRTVEHLGGPLPPVALDVWIEPALVRWVLPNDPDGLAPIATDELATHVLEIAARHVELASEPGPWTLLVDLELDLHSPNRLGLRLVTTLLEVGDGEPALRAIGGADPLRLPRLFCHGCREAWSGHGTRIYGPDAGHSVAFDGFYDGGTFGGNDAATYIKD